MASIWKRFSARDCVMWSRPAWSHRNSYSGTRTNTWENKTISLNRTSLTDVKLTNEMTNKCFFCNTWDRLVACFSGLRCLYFSSCCPSHHLSLVFSVFWCIWNISLVLFGPVVCQCWWVSLVSLSVFSSIHLLSFSIIPFPSALFLLHVSRDGLKEHILFSTRVQRHYLRVCHLLVITLNNKKAIVWNT